MHEGPMDEDTTHILPTGSLGVDEGMTGVDLSHSFNDPLLSMTREHDYIINVFN